MINIRCRECLIKYQKGENGSNWKGGVSKVKCKNCGKEINNKGNTKYCLSCFKLINKGSNNVMFGRRGLNTNRWKNDTVQHFCEVCGKPFKRNVKNHTVCIKCYSGKYTPAYIDGRSKCYSNLYKYDFNFRGRLKK